MSIRSRKYALSCLTNIEGKTAESEQNDKICTKDSWKRLKSVVLKDTLKHRLTSTTLWGEH